MTVLRILLIGSLWLLAPAAWAQEPPQGLLRIWTIEKPLCPGPCGKFTLDYVNHFAGKQIDVGHDWFTNDMYESCRRGAHYDDMKQQEAARFLAAYKVKPDSLGIRQKTVWAGRVFCHDTVIATLIYVSEKKLILVFEQGVFVPLK